jgi:DNA-binding response OmpR family regulator
VSRILLIEDEPDIASFIARGLRAAGYSVTALEEGLAALAVASEDDFDLVVLDLGLPDLDGLAVLRQLRRSDVHTPVIILTARDGVRDRVDGLDSGADDYLTKPFAVEELEARIRARLRGGALEGPPTVLRSGSGSVEVDLLSRRTYWDGQEVELTARELLLAETFLRHPGQVLSRQQLLTRVWGYDFDPTSNVVDVYVGYLRRKLGPDFVVTVRGLGYRSP